MTAGTRPRLLIISFSRLVGDARVLKQIALFRDRYAVTTIGYGPAPDGAARHIAIPDELPLWRWPRIPLILKQYRRAYWSNPAIAFARRALSDVAADAVLANDVEAAGLALEIVPGERVHSDLHEYAPRQKEDVPRWRLFVQPFVTWQVRTFVARAGSHSTVGQRIAREYAARFGFTPTVVTNAAPYAECEPTPTGPTIRLVHSGACLADRGIDEIITAVESSSAALTLDLYLTPNDPAYLDSIRARVADSTRVTLHDPVSYAELGATLRRYDVGGRAVVQGFPATAIPDGGRGQVLAPWPNRIADGRYRWAGSDLQLALTEVAQHNAIHGLVRWLGWRLQDRSDTALTMATTVWPTPGYPFRLELAATYRLSDDGLLVALRARNDGADTAPYGVGQHPYLVAGQSRVDEWSLTVPARTRLLVDARGNPAGRADVAGTPYDFRISRPIGALALDAAYTDLVADTDGWTRVRVEGASGSGVELRADAAARWLQVFTGDTLAPGRRRTGLAVEPMSAPPGAFVSGEDLVRLGPGDHHVLRWGLRAW